MHGMMPMPSASASLFDPVRPGVVGHVVEPVPTSRSRRDPNRSMIR